MRRHTTTWARYLGEHARQDEAVECYRAAIAINPAFAQAHNNLGTALRALGQLDDAVASYRRAIAIDPDYADAHNNLGMALLARGDLAPGWAEYEWRWETPHLRRARRDFAQPQWRGEPGQGRTLLIYAEQGFGDTLQFCRYIPLAAARGWRVIVEVPRTLVRLMRVLPGIDQVLERGEPLPHFDLHCPMLSLPSALGTDTIADIPHDIPYLHADSAQVAAWRARLAALGKPGPRIGVVWAGSSRLFSPTGVALDRRRSIAPDRLAPLFEQSGAQFFSLLKDGPAPPTDFLLTDFMSEMSDFADTAALVANLDLVISVDTAVAHLAAATGKPVWLLDRFDPDWRWLLGRSDSPWYPTLRIFRQPKPGDWDAVFDAVRIELKRQWELRQEQEQGQDSPMPALALPDDLRTIFDAAVQHHQAGRPADAEPLYREVLAANPRHADSLHLLGVIAGQTGRHDLAVEKIRQAIAIDPRQPAYHANLGLTLKAQGRLDEAIACFCSVTELRPNDPQAHLTFANMLREHGRLDAAAASYRTAIKLKPDYREALNNLGNTLKDLGQLDEAVACYRQAVNAAPDFPEAHNNLGVALQQQGQTEAAVACYRTAIHLKPDYPDAHNNLGIVLRAQGWLDEALLCFRRALDLRPNHAAAHNNLAIALQATGRLDEAVARFGVALELRPDDPETLTNLGIAYQAQGRLDEAAASHQRAIGLRPDFPEAHYNLGNVRWEQERPDDAAACYRRAVELRPDYAEAHANLGNALRRQGRLDAAVASYRTAIGLQPDYVDAHNHLGMALLASGDLAEGWVEYEWRWQTAQMLRDRRPFTQPQWRGEPAEGRTLLVHAEQGFGDTLQFCRYAGLAAERGLRVIVEVQPALARLCRSLRGVAQVIARGAPLPAFDLHCPMLSLPLALGTTLATVPGATPYLHADADQVEAWRTRLAAMDDPRPRIGLVWAGNPRKLLPVWEALARRRSIAPERFAPLFQVSGAHFFSLQKDGPAAPSEFPLTDVMAEMTDFADTAALIANLDLVISVDTAVAHLAGALGKPVWVLDLYDPCWRWMLGREDSPWYPTLRLFRQPDPGNWQAVIERVAAELRDVMPPTVIASEAKQSPARNIANPRGRLLRFASKKQPVLHGSHVMAGEGPPSTTMLRAARKVVDADPGLRSGQALRRHDVGGGHHRSFVQGGSAAAGRWPTRNDTAAADSDVRAALDTAVRHHHAGRLAEAESLYRQVLATDPHHPGALHGLGVLGGQTGRHDLAIDMIGQAIAIDPGNPSYHADLGVALKAQQRLDEAEASFRTALALRPDDPEAHHNLGVALAAQGRLDDAAACYRQAIAFRPDFPRAHHDLGNVLLKQRRPDEAAASYRRCLDLEPDHREAHTNLGIALKAQGRLDEAVTHFRRALDLRPDDAEAHANLGVALKAQGRLDEAVACFHRALELKPDFAGAHTNLGNALDEQGRPDEAIASHGTAIALTPDDPVAHNNLAIALKGQGRLDEAIGCYRRAVVLDPDYAEAHCNLAMALLAHGDLPEGWQEFEWRWQTPHMFAARRGFAQPQWRGEPAAGQTLLIHAEQGFGDTLQFCRYASLAAARGLRVILEVPQPLIRLLRALPGVDRLVERGEALPDFDLHCPMLSLPLALRTTLATIPAEIPYLQADPALVEAWRTRLAATGNQGPGIGLAWASNAHNLSLTQRSLPPEHLMPLRDLSGAHFVSLQKAGPAAPAAMRLTDFMGEMTDFADTAALIANLDLVISVDTAVAHLAAALGKPVWLLTCFDPCWRWLTGRHDSPWYPTLRLFRQPKPREWDSVIASVLEEARALFSVSWPGLARPPTALLPASVKAVGGRAKPGHDTEVPGHDTEVPSQETEVPSHETAVPGHDTEVSGHDTDIGGRPDAAPASQQDPRPPSSGDGSSDTTPPSLTPDLQTLFAAAVQHHQAGRLAEAEPLYRQILTTNPDHADSHHLLGVIGGADRPPRYGDRAHRPGDRHQPQRGPLPFQPGHFPEAPGPPR